MLLEEADVAAAAAALGMGEDAFIDRHAVLARNRAQLTLRETETGACEFLEESGDCRIYAARPKQCREFPRGWRVDGCPGLRPEPFAARVRAGSGALDRPAFFV